MKTLRATIFLFFIFLQLGFSETIVDSTGNTIALSTPPSRIITLAPSLSELAADLLDDDIGKIIGVSEHTDYPPVLKNVPSVGSYVRFNLEKIVHLKPDLVIATKDGNPKDRVLHLREMGIPVLVVSTKNISEIFQSIKMISRALAVADRGDALIRRLKRGIDKIKKRNLDKINKSKKKVLLQIGDAPLVVVGNESFLHDALEIVGAENIYKDLDSRYPRPSLEDVFSRNPEVVIVLSMSDVKDSITKMALKWISYKTIAAVKNKRVHILRADSLLRPSMRLLEGLSLLEKTIYSTEEM